METSLSQQQINDLVEAAREAREEAYMPYSRFAVGAALLGSDGEIYRGCNVENGSFGLSLCAERVAVGNAVIAGCRDFSAIAIVTGYEGIPVTPCGACRQVLAEFNPLLSVVCANEEGAMRVFRLDELMPHPFDFGLS
jgi:cytidine deaminase